MKLKNYNIPDTQWQYIWLFLKGSFTVHTWTKKSKLLCWNDLTLDRVFRLMFCLFMSMTVIKLFVLEVEGYTTLTLTLTRMAHSPL